MKGKLQLWKCTKDGKPTVRVVVLGNVGQENRAKMDILGLIPVVDISNCRERYVSSSAELEALRDALVAQGIVDR